MFAVFNNYPTILVGTILTQIKTYSAEKNLKYFSIFRILFPFIFLSLYHIRHIFGTGSFNLCQISVICNFQPKDSTYKVLNIQCFLTSFKNLVTSKTTFSTERLDCSQNNNKILKWNRNGKVTGIKLIWSQLNFRKEVVNATNILRNVFAGDKANFQNSQSVHDIALYTTKIVIKNGSVLNQI